jgi:hypothetical protein
MARQLRQGGLSASSAFNAMRHVIWKCLTPPGGGLGETSLPWTTNDFPETAMNKSPAFSSKKRSGAHCKRSSTASVVQPPSFSIDRFFHC